MIPIRTSSGKKPMIDLVRIASTGIWPQAFRFPGSQVPRLGAYRAESQPFLTHRHFWASQDDGG